MQTDAELPIYNNNNYYYCGWSANNNTTTTTNFWDSTRAAGFTHCKKAATQYPTRKARQPHFPLPRVADNWQKGKNEDYIL